MGLRDLRERSAARHDWPATIRSIVLQAALLFAALQLYQFVRTLAEGDRARAFANSRELLGLEELVGLDIELGIQRAVLGNERLVDVVNQVYVVTFWPVVIATLPILFVFARTQYRHYRNALILSGLVGLVVFAIYPVAPPRMLDGYVDTIHTFTNSGDLAHPGSFTNQYAAMPSFHVGWLVLAGAAAMPAVPWRRLRPLLLLPAAMMTFTVMATANHYLIDAVAGAAVALGALAIARRMPSAAELRRQARAAVTTWAESVPPMDLGGIGATAGAMPAQFGSDATHLSVVERVGVNRADRLAGEHPARQAVPQLR